MVSRASGSSPAGRYEWRGRIIGSLSQRVGCRLFVCGAHRGFGYATATADSSTAVAAARITSSTKRGWESIGTWLLSTSYVVAPMRFATKRSRSGGTVRSLLATMYQLGFDLQATPSALWPNR